MKKAKKIEGTSFEDVMKAVAKKLKQQEKMTPEQLRKQQEKTQKILEELGPGGPTCITFFKKEEK